MKEYKIHLLWDKKDYKRKITSDVIFNITGEKGSGKSYFGNMMDESNRCIVIHLDSIFIKDGIKKHDTSYEIRKILEKKYGEELDPDKYFESNYYNDIVEYVKNKNKKAYIEGIQLADVKDISILKGRVVIKRTGVLKSFLRTIRRDYHNEYFMNEEIKRHGKFKAKFVRLRKVIKRRKKIFKTYHNIEKFIKRVDEYNRK